VCNVSGHLDQVLRPVFQSKSAKCTQTHAGKTIKSPSFRSLNNPPKIRPQIHNLPRPQPNQHAHRPKRKPLDPLIRTLIGIPELLLPPPQILHLRHDLVDRLLDATQLRLDRLQLLCRRDPGPVLGVGPDVDVEFDVSGGGGA
jgi:hypothetical protein